LIVGLLLDLIDKEWRKGSNGRQYCRPLRQVPLDADSRFLVAGRGDPFVRARVHRQEADCRIEDSK
jgi:hypothetical protein